MFKKIVVGIDGADGGNDALAVAKALAGPETALVLVGAFPYESRPSRASVEGFEEILRADTVQVLRSAASDDERCDFRAVPDVSPGRALHRVAEEIGADLIVIGSSHRGPLGRVLIGDVSRATLHGAGCPVAVAPKGSLDYTGEIEMIGVACNDTRQSDAAVELAAAIGAEHGAELRLTTAVASPINGGMGYAFAYDWSAITGADLDDAKSRLAEKAATLDVAATVNVVEGGTGPVLERLSKDADLIVAGSRGWGTGRAVMLGSTTDRLVHHASCPVIIVPSPVGDDEATAVPTDQVAHA